MCWLKLAFMGGSLLLTFAFYWVILEPALKKKKMVMLLFEGLIGCPQECRNEKGFSPGLAGDELFWG